MLMTSGGFLHVTVLDSLTSCNVTMNAVKSETSSSRCSWWPGDIKTKCLLSNQKLVKQTSNTEPVLKRRTDSVCC